MKQSLSRRVNRGIGLKAARGEFFPL